MEIEAVILAAGEGRRMHMPGISKALIPIGGKPMICNSIDALSACGIKKIWIVKYFADSFDVLDDIYMRTDLSISYIDDYERKGSLFSFSLACKYVKDIFVCLDCDLHIDIGSFSRMLNAGMERIDIKKDTGVMAYVKQPSREDSNMLLIADGYVVRFIKNGDSSCKRGGYIYLWRKSIFDDVRTFFEKKCYSLSKYYDHVVQNYPVGVMEIDDVWDIDNVDDVRYTNAIIERRGMIG